MRKGGFMKRKIVCLLVALVLIVSGGAGTAFAVKPIVEIDITEWYSDSADVGMWSDTDIKVYVGTDASYASLSVANLRDYFTTAKASWSFLGRSFSNTSTQSEADIVLSGITRSQADVLGIQNNACGITKLATSEKPVIIHYGSAQKKLHDIRFAAVYLIESAPTLSTTGAEKVAVHEFGHAVGYFGHYEWGNVMTTLYENITSLTPSAKEKRHLSQFY